LPYALGGSGLASRVYMMFRSRKTHRCAFGPAVLTGLLMFGGCTTARPVEAGPGTPEGGAGLGSLSRSFEALSRERQPSVVQVLASGYHAVHTRSAGTVLTKRRVTGSGVIVSQDGDIITNAHVVRGAKTIHVRLAPVELPGQQSIVTQERDLIEANLIGLDFQTDLAVIRVEGMKLKPAPLGASEKVEPGQIVLAFGNPLGLQGSVTMGVVGAKARQLRRDDPMIYIQTDAPINPGNSGGPLVNTAGEVVGINTFILSQSGGSQGLGFAVPSNVVKAVYTRLKTSGRVQRGMIGARAQTINAVLASGLKLPRSRGVVVANVIPASPADKAGIREGDIITQIDGKTMENARDYDITLYLKEIGSTAKVRFLRGDSEREASVEVVERPYTLESLAESFGAEENLIPKLGVLAINLTAELQFLVPQAREGGGILVATSFSDGPVHDLSGGDIVRQLNGREVRTVKELKKALDELHYGAPVVLVAERAGTRRFVTLEAE
jgi:serine protease Do